MNGRPSIPTRMLERRRYRQRPNNIDREPLFVLEIILPVRCQAFAQLFLRFLSIPFWAKLQPQPSRWDITKLSKSVFLAGNLAVPSSRFRPYFDLSSSSSSSVRGQSSRNSL